MERIEECTRLKLSVEILFGSVENFCDIEIVSAGHLLSHEDNKQSVHRTSLQPLKNNLQDSGLKRIHRYFVPGPLS
ncbi:hypothetical protein [Rhizobium sp. BK377]|uniref:hypothetical protein n=1 Tax=Rhizobium sp. BK377 TaxID=2587058 RepID=UPI0016143AAD|nr:hypothetical protein [Rhizobium sp. BK377]MBB3464288.1 hypothetical protein [Rhizobium sp. BK377]